MEHQGPQCTADRVWVIHTDWQMWCCQLPLLFFLKASIYLHYNMRVSAVIKKQKGWSCLDNTNSAGSRTKRGGVKNLVVLACANFMILSCFKSPSLVVKGNTEAKAEGISLCSLLKEDLGYHVRKVAWCFLETSRRKGHQPAAERWECQPELPD